MHKRGFTIVELLIVIVIISIISVVGIVSYGSFKEKSLNAQVMADFQNIENAILAYKSENGNLPNPGGNKNFFDESSNYAHDELSAFGVYGQITDEVFAKYLGITPLDPRTNHFYSYGKTFKSNKFQIGAVGLVGGKYTAMVKGDYDGKEGVHNLIREYNGPVFVKDGSLENLPYNPQDFLMTGKVGSINGPSPIKINGSNFLEADAKNIILKAGDKIEVEAGNYANIYFSDGSFSTLGHPSIVSELTIAEMKYPKENNLSTKIYLVLGNGLIWTKATTLNNSSGNESSFKVSTRDTEAAVRGTIFGVLYNGSNTQISVQVGEVKVGKIMNGNIRTANDLTEQVKQNGSEAIFTTNIGGLGTESTISNTVADYIRYLEDTENIEKIPTKNIIIGGSVSNAINADLAENNKPQIENPSLPNSYLIIEKVVYDKNIPSAEIHIASEFKNVSKVKIDAEERGIKYGEFSINVDSSGSLIFLGGDMNFVGLGSQTSLEEIVENSDLLYISVCDIYENCSSKSIVDISKQKDSYVNESFIGNQTITGTRVNLNRIDNKSLEVIERELNTDVPPEDVISEDAIPDGVVMVNPNGEKLIIKKDETYQSQGYTLVGYAPFKNESLQMYVLESLYKDGKIVESLTEENPALIEFVNSFSEDGVKLKTENSNLEFEGINKLVGNANYIIDINLDKNSLISDGWWGKKLIDFGDEYIYIIKKNSAIGYKIHIENYIGGVLKSSLEKKETDLLNLVNQLDKLSIKKVGNNTELKITRIGNKNATFKFPLEKVKINGPIDTIDYIKVYKGGHTDTISIVDTSYTLSWDDEDKCAVCLNGVTELQDGGIGSCGPFAGERNARYCTGIQNPNPLNYCAVERKVSKWYGSTCDGWIGNAGSGIFDY